MFDHEPFLRPDRKHNNAPSADAVKDCVSNRGTRRAKRVLDGSEHGATMTRPGDEILNPLFRSRREPVEQIVRIHRPR